MDIKELSDFVDWTLNKWRYSTTSEWTEKERFFGQSLKISEEVWELSEQVLWKFGWQRLKKMDKISDEKLENEIADVIIATMRLARMMDLDVNELLKNKIEILKKRFEK